MRISTLIIVSKWVLLFKQHPSYNLEIDEKVVHTIYMTVPSFVKKGAYPYYVFKRVSFKKKIVIVVGLFILFLTISSVVQNALKPAPYTLAKAQKSNITEVVSESGNISLSNKANVYSTSTGIVEEIYVTNGDQVNEGDELFKVESTATEQERSAAYANYLTAQSALKTAQSNADVLRADMYGKWKSYRDMATNDTYETGDGVAKEREREAAEFQIAQDTWKAAEAKYKDQQTAIAQAQAQVTSTYLLYQATQNTVVKAPISGTVSNVSVAQGSSVAVNSPTSLTTPIPALSIANFSTTEAVVALNESDALKVKEGQVVEIDVNAIDNKKFRGRVVRVDDIGTNNQGVVQYNAYIEVFAPGQNLKAGMTVDVDITTNKISSVLSVPNAAVKPYQGGRAVRIVNPKTKKIEFIPVVTGVKGEERTQILSGISEGQEVVTALANDQIKRPGLF